MIELISKNIELLPQNCPNSPEFSRVVLRLTVLLAS